MALGSDEVGWYTLGALSVVVVAVMELTSVAGLPHEVGRYALGALPVVGVPVVAMKFAPVPGRAPTRRRGTTSGDTLCGLVKVTVVVQPVAPTGRRAAVKKGVLAPQTGSPPPPWVAVGGPTVARRPRKGLCLPHEVGGDTLGALPVVSVPVVTVKVVLKFGSIHFHRSDRKYQRVGGSDFPVLLLPPPGRSQVVSPRNRGLNGHPSRPRRTDMDFVCLQRSSDRTE